MIQIRLMTRADIPLVMQLITHAGWNQTEPDLRRFLTLAPDGCFVAESDGIGVGTVATWIFGPVAWIGMMLVEQDHRGRGIGKRLMKQAIDWLESQRVETIRFDATPLGLPVYERLGFVRQFDLSRFGGTPDAPSCNGALSPLEQSMHEDVLALDHQVTSTDRSRLLTVLFHQHPQESFVSRRDQAVTGFITDRPGALATQIGPCSAIDAAAGRALLSRVLSRFRNHKVFVDIPHENIESLEFVRSAGLSARRGLTRMVRGREVCERIDSLWASSGPEKG